MLVDSITVKLSPKSYWYHMHLEKSRTLLALDNWWVVSYLTMWIGVYVHWWNLVNVVNTWKRWIVWIAWLWLYTWWFIMIWSFIYH